MKKSKFGFTLIEVTLFLALSSFLMVGLIIGANNSISRQRYNDSVNSFADFLRGVYSDVLNVSNDNATVVDGVDEFNGGRSSTAVYGKLVTFGEFDAISSPTAPTRSIYVYDVVGKAVNSASVSSSNVLDIMKNSVADGGIAASIFRQENCTVASSCHNYFYRMNSYSIPWEANLETMNSVNCESDDIACRFKGAMLVVRSPVTGSIRTYVYSGDVLDLHNYGDNGPYASTTNAPNRFKTLLSSMAENDLDMCLDSDDNRNGNRRDIRILKGANNSSGVFLAELDSRYNANDNPNGSKCLGR